MKLEELKMRRKRSRYFEGLFAKNPVLIGGLALPFAIMISTNLKNSVSISILLACSLIPTVLLAVLIGSYLPKWFAPVIYAMVSMGLVIACTPLILPISPEISDSLGIYIPIISINSLLLTLCERYSGSTRRPSVMALVDSISYSLGFAVAICMIACLRELFGNNTIWGIPVSLPVKIGGLQIAFAGFIFTAFFSALFRFVKRLMLRASYRHYNLTEEHTAQ